MSNPIQCPECSASNPPGSSWCNLCFARFGSTEAETDLADPNPGPERLEADLAAPTNPPPPPRPPEGEQLALLDIGEEEDTKLWTCRFCDTKNPVGSDYCTACQQPIYHSFGGQPAAVEVEPMDALRRSAVPGGGLILLKQGILGGTILALTVISLIAGVYLLRLGVVAYGAALVFVGLTLWMLAAHDAFRIASGHGDEIFLRPRVVSIVGGVWFSLIVAAAVQGQRALNQ